MVKRNKYMNVPEIRFKGLDKTWNKKTLDELVQLNSGMDYKHLCNGNIPVYGTGGYMLSVNAALSYDKDAIGIGRKGTINKPYILKAPFWTVDTLFYAIPRKYNNLQFCNCIFQRIDWLKYDESTGVPSLSKNIINSIEVNCAPSYDEQQKIASYFQSLDSLIQTTSKKLVSLKQIKDASLQSMFPQEEETVPKVRFKGFEEEWSLKYVFELLCERNELSPQSPEFPLMAFIANNGIAEKGERYDRSALVNDVINKQYKRTYYGDFIYSSNNLETGSIGLNTYGKATISPVYSIFYCTLNSDSNFVGYCMTRKSFIKEMIKWRQGVMYGQWRIHEKDFLRIKVLVPSLPEQQQIGTYFRNLDQQISLQTQRLEKLKQIKTACLDKMFV